MDLNLDPPPADCGRRLIPTLLDEIAASSPERTYAAIPRDNYDLSKGWEDISFRRVAIAISRTARWIESKVGLGNGESALLYMGPLDLRYPILAIAAAKTGNVAQFTSSRNSFEAHLSLIDKAGAKVFIVPDDVPAIATDIIAARELKVVGFPSLETLLAVGEDNEIYPWQATFDEARNKPFVILHTSGSTGIPKPVNVTHGTFCSNDMHQAIPSLGGRPTVWNLIKKKRVFVAFPLFHAACLGLILGYNLWNDITCVLPPPIPLTADVVDQAHMYANCEGSIIPPSIITELHKSPAAFENMIVRNKFVAYVGGVLAQEVGDKIAPRTKLLTMMGATETMWLPIELVDEPENWQQIPMSPFLGHEYVPARDGLAELVIKRNKDYDLFQGAFSTFPHLNEYGMSDLYRQHSTVPRYWQFSSRADDIICFSNAEKLNPITMESVIASDPLVKSALVGGHGQFQASLLVEPITYPENEAAEEEFIDNIWPTVMKANRDTVAHGRVMKDFIFLTNPEKPLPRAGKDTVQRAGALKLYLTEFEEIYKKNARASEAEAASAAKALPTGTEQDVVDDKFASIKTETEQATNEIGQTAAEAARHVYQTPGNTELNVDLLFHKLDRLGDTLEKILQKLGEMSADSLRPAPADPASQVVDPGTKKIAIQIPVSNPEAASETTTQVAPSPTHSSPVSIIDDTSRIVSSATSITSYSPADMSEIKGTLSKLVMDNAVVHGLTETNDFFNCGLDSLQVPVLVKAINRKFGHQITSKDIFSNPTVEKLSLVIASRTRV